MGDVQSNTRPADPPRATELDALLTPQLLAVTASARRRALRDGDRQIDTAHLLHSLLEADARVRGLFAPPQIARLLGYLVQRSIGFGLQWQASVEDSGQLPQIPAAAGRGAAPLREPLPAPPETGPGTRHQVRWSPSAATALHRAVLRAQDRAEPRADGIDLLAALAADPESRAVEVLRFAGVDVGRMATILPY